MERVKEGNKVDVLFIYSYNNRIMKLVEIILSMGEGRREMMKGMNLAKVHCKHIWKCDNEPTPCTTNT
jgi:hypothetical protein